nr:unnamed protein product [Callosobruchus analis]
MRLRRKSKRTGKHWVHPLWNDRLLHGKFYTMYYKVQEHPRTFFSYFRMSVRSFDQLLRTLAPALIYENANLRLSVKYSQYENTKLRLNKKKKRKNIWVKEWLQKRSILSHIQLIKELRNSSENDLKNYLRMNEECFQLLLSSIKPHITKKDTVMRESISAEERLLVTLRYLATGRSMEDLKFSAIISPQALGNIIPETCKYIYLVLKDEYLKFPKDVHERQEVARDFLNRWNFPNCGGAIDGKHIRIVKPKNSGSYYFNYKEYCSIVLLAVVNANYEFVYINVGCNGRVSDGGVFDCTDFHDKLMTKTLNLPSVQDTTENLNFVFVADDAFALSENILKPYPQKQLSPEQRIFNYRLSRARRVVENAFGILANRFRVFHTEINMDPNKIDFVVLAAGVLHNFLRKHARSSYTPANSFDQEILDTGEIVHGEWRQGQYLDGLQFGRGKNATENAKANREKYKNYFMTTGKVSWQNNFL